jgi:methyl-accepting chemotaxis protein
MVGLLIALAGAIFAGVCALWVLFPGLSGAGQRWANIVAGLILIALIVSIVFGGRGFMYGPKRPGWLDRFNLQAAFGVAAIILIIVLVGIMHFTSEPSQNEKVAAAQTALETRVKDLTEKIDNMQKDLAVQLNGISTKSGVVSNDVSDLKNKADAVQKNLDELNRMSTDNADALRQIGNDLKSLSGRVDQLEKNASQTK